MERQLVGWGELFRADKTLRIDLSFNYVENSRSSTVTSRKGDERGALSVTQKMLAKRATQLDAEEADAGRPSIWREVYNLMRCPGPPCNLGPHYWRDPGGKRHYMLRIHYLKGLIKHVEQGYTLQTHDDVAEEVRQQLYAESSNVWKDTKHPPRRRCLAFLQLMLLTCFQRSLVR